ncbi:hypothetical protein PSAC2689_60166 [Paraburkholderia sacchari]
MSLSRHSNDSMERMSTSAIGPDYAFARPDRFQLFLDVFATNGVGMCWTFSLPHFGQGG